MKLASFLYQGKRSYGIVQADGVIDLGRRLGDRYSDLKALLQGNGLAQATRYLNDAVDVPMSAITRTVEIDLRQAVGDAAVPPPLHPVRGILR